jgi:hypothetical protein
VPTPRATTANITTNSALLPSCEQTVLNKRINAPCFMTSSLATCDAACCLRGFAVAGEGPPLLLLLLLLLVLSPPLSPQWRTAQCSSVSPVYGCVCRGGEGGWRVSVLDVIGGLVGDMEGHQSIDPPLVCPPPSHYTHTPPSTNLHT